MQHAENIHKQHAVSPTHVKHFNLFNTSTSLNTIQCKRTSNYQNIVLQYTLLSILTQLKEIQTLCFCSFSVINKYIYEKEDTKFI